MRKITAKERMKFKKGFEETGKAGIARVGSQFFHAKLDRTKDRRVTLRIELYEDDEKFEGEDEVNLGYAASNDQICELALNRIEATMKNVLPTKKKKGA